MEEMTAAPSVPAGAGRTTAASDPGAPRDLRDWIHRVEAIGQLRRITEPVSRNEEMGAITYLAHQEIGAPALLFETNPMGARLNALFSSDIGHMDVPDMTEVLPEAYELVEHGLLTDDDFRDFMFENAVRFWGEVNPDFFKGTVVEKQAAKVLAEPAARP